MERKWENGALIKKKVHVIIAMEYLKQVEKNKTGVKTSSTSLRGQSVS
jgi:hypothetical protein